MTRPEQQSGGQVDVFALSARWKAAREAFLQEIAEIDEAAAWQPIEPAWWLEMMAVERAIRGVK